MAEGVYLIVTRSMFLEALEPLVQQRRSEGFAVVVSIEPVEVALRSYGPRPAMILLVGDDAAGTHAHAPWSLPAQRAPFYRWRATQAEEMPTDAVYGDLDDDGLPDIPVGRLPVRTVDQAAAIVAKILAYEQAPPRLEDLTIPLWAGTAGVGPMVDAVVEGLVTTTLQDLPPAWVQPWAIFARAGSPLCHWPPMQAQAFQQQCRQGGAMAWLIGHGDRQTFYSMEFAGQSIGYGVATVEATLAKGPPTGPLVILACSCGDFAAAGDCLAEAMLRAPAGPVAVIAATAESHPLPNYHSARCLTAELGGGQRRLGQLWLAAQQAAYRAKNPVVDALLAGAEGTLEATINVGRLHRDQLLVYALLGDPATRLKLPQPLHGRLTRRESRWHWRIDKPPDADVLYVSFRPPVSHPQSPLASKLASEEESAIRNSQSSAPALRSPAAPAGQAAAESAHRAANTVFAFQPLATLGKDEPWEGICDRPGVLRLVAVGERAIYAVALHLRVPTPTTGPTAQPR